MLKFIISALIGAGIYAYATGDITNQDLILIKDTTVGAIEATIDAGSSVINYVTDSKE